MSDTPYYNNNRLTQKDGRWCMFDCCGRCPIDSDDEAEQCKPSYWFFSDADDNAISQMTHLQRGKLTIGKFEGKAWFRVPEPNWRDEIEKCRNNPYYFFTNYCGINGQLATTKLTEQEFNDFFLDLVKKVEPITGKPD